MCIDFILQCIDFTSTINDFPLSEIFERDNSQRCILVWFGLLWNEYVVTKGFRQSAHGNATRCRNSFSLSYVTGMINGNRKCHWSRIHISFLLFFISMRWVGKTFYINCFRELSLRLYYMIIYRILLEFIQLIEHFRRLSLLRDLISSFVE